MCSDDLLVRFKTTASMLSVTMSGAEGKVRMRTLHRSYPTQRSPGSALQLPLSNKHKLMDLGPEVWIVKDLRYRPVAFPSPAIRN
jgi:hypothetical protein